MRTQIIRRSTFACIAALTLASVFVACGSDTADESLGSASSRVTSSLTISGHVTNSQGLPIVGITVRLSGSKVADAVTDATGAYRFAGLAAGSYSIRPNVTGCSFTPDVINLNNLSSSVVRDFVGAGSSCPVGRVDAGAEAGGDSGSIADAAADVTAGDAGTGSTCTFNGPDAGSNLHFATTLACPASSNPADASVCQASCVPLVLDEQLTPVPGGAVNHITVTRGGAVLMTFTTTTTDGGALTVAADFFPPFQGIRHFEAVSTDGTNFVATIDGRTTLPFLNTTPPDAIQFVDGGPAPSLTIDPSLSASLNALFIQATREVQTCVATVSGADGATAQASPATAGHPSNTIGPLACQLCRVKCSTGHLTCFYGAAAGCASATGFFGLFTFGLAPFACFLTAEAGCFAAWSGCLLGCQTEGIGLFQGCCPVNCGGSNRVIFDPATTGFEGCCLSGETCLSKSTHLCCSSGTSACGGTECCTSAETCIPASGAVPAFCCPAPVRNGECCFGGTCGSRADCNGGDPNGPNGCDANGCCVVG